MININEQFNNSNDELKNDSNNISLKDDDLSTDSNIKFNKLKLNNFFLMHRKIEWFRTRYHPDEIYKQRIERNQFILNRLKVFMDFINSRNVLFENASAEMDHSINLTKFLDAGICF
jgi:hypothetical protein